MKIDPNKTTIQNLLSLLMEKNPGLVIREDQVTFGQPEPYTDPKGINNTKIRVTAVKNRGYSGTRELHYKRQTLPEGINRVPKTMAVYPTDTLTKIAQAIVGNLGKMASDVLLDTGSSFSLPSSSTPTRNATVKVVADSILFAPNTTQLVAMNWTLPVVEKTAVMSGNNLNTLTLMGNPTAVAAYRLTVTGKVGSLDTLTPALLLGKLPEGSTFTLINRGTIQGHGGQGGAYNAAGNPGGPAVKALMDAIIDNTDGYIFGGGGGGGGSSFTYGFLGLSYVRSAGGGGSGDSVGTPGTGTAVSSGASIRAQATSGTASAGGVGANTGASNDTTMMCLAGNGGAPGNAGSTGSVAKGRSTGTATTHPGGAAGRAVDVNGFKVTWLAGNTASRVKGLVT